MTTIPACTLPPSQRLLKLANFATVDVTVTSIDGFAEDGWEVVDVITALPKTLSPYLMSSTSTVDLIVSYTATLADDVHTGLSNPGIATLLIGTPDGVKTATVNYYSSGVCHCYFDNTWRDDYTQTNLPCTPDYWVNDSGTLAVTAWKSTYYDGEFYHYATMVGGPFAFVNGKAEVVVDETVVSDYSRPIHADCPVRTQRSTYKIGLVCRTADYNGWDPSSNYDYNRILGNSIDYRPNVAYYWSLIGGNADASFAVAKTFWTYEPDGKYWNTVRYGNCETQATLGRIPLP